MKPRTTIHLTVSMLSLRRRVWFYFFTKFFSDKDIWAKFESHISQVNICLYSLRSSLLFWSIFFQEEMHIHNCLIVLREKMEIWMCSCRDKKGHWIFACKVALIIPSSTLLSIIISLLLIQKNLGHVPLYIYIYTMLFKITLTCSLTCQHG